MTSLYPDLVGPGTDAFHNVLITPQESKTRSRCTVLIKAGSSNINAKFQCLWLAETGWTDACTTGIISNDLGTIVPSGAYYRVDIGLGKDFLGNGKAC